MKIYDIAGKKIAIETVHSYTHKMCARYLSAGEPELTVITTEADIAYERERSTPETHASSDAYLETLAVYRRIAEEMALHHGAFLFHGSAIAVDGEAYLFTAASGTGKSTHTALWRRCFGERALMVNDDKPLIRITPQDVLVCGTPWDGKHRLSNNVCLPLRGLCILERAEQNHIAPIDRAAAYPMLLQQTYHPREPLAMLQTLAMIDELCDRVRLYRLGCNMDPSAAEVAYRGMKLSDQVK